MDTPPSLNDRHQQILRATVQHYIATAEPVSSQTLAQEYAFTVSSATIRHALGHLERAGLLYQPHVSAGRIPSDWGYRLYVDRLLTWNDRQTRAMKKQLRAQLRGELWNFDALLQRMGQILAELSGYITLITLPQTEMVLLRYLRLMRLGEQEILMILVTDTFHSHSLSCQLPPAAQHKAPAELDQELEILSNFLNHHLQGKSLSELTHLNWQELDAKFGIYTGFLQALQEHPAFQRRTASVSPTPLVVHGLSKVIGQPEFAHLDQVQTLLSLLEQEQEALLAIVFDPDSPAEEAPARYPQATLRIGSENPLESMHPCTLISAFYHQNQVPVGSVSLLGPTRMAYHQAIPLVEQAADYLSEALNSH